MKRNDILYASICDRHIERMVAMVKNSDFDGIEEFVDIDILEKAAISQISRLQEQLISYGVTDIDGASINSNQDAGVINGKREG